MGLYSEELLKRPSIVFANKLDVRNLKNFDPATDAIYDSSEQKLRYGSPEEHSDLPPRAQSLKQWTSVFDAPKAGVDFQKHRQLIVRMHEQRSVTIKKQMMALRAEAKRLGIPMIEGVFIVMISY